MKNVTIRELHNRTCKPVRGVSLQREIRVTDKGRVLAKIAPQTQAAEIPYFARRKSSAAFKRLDDSGKTGQGTDSTKTISEDREEQGSNKERAELESAMSKVRQKPER